MRIYILHSRGIDASADVAALEREGHQVHYPARDTNQNCTELEICTQNREAIARAGEVHVYWDGTSHGAIFDLGMAFALRKKNRVKKLPQKSLLNLIRSLADIHA